MWMFTLLVGWAIFLIKDKLYERKIEVALVQQWERGNGGPRQTDVPCKAAPPPSFWTEGITAKMAAWAPGPQGLTSCMLPDTISLNPTSKWIFRPWHNSSSSLPVLLTTSLSVSVSHFFYFPYVGHGEVGVGCIIFQIPLSKTGFRCFIELGVWGSSL